MAATARAEYAEVREMRAAEREQRAVAAEERAALAEQRAVNAEMALLDERRRWESLAPEREAAMANQQDSYYKGWAAGFSEGLFGGAKDK